LLTYGVLAVFIFKLIVFYLIAIRLLLFGDILFLVY